MCRITLSEIMTQPVQCLSPEASLSEVISTLHVNKYSCVVIASTKNVPVGIITERDLVGLFATQQVTKQKTPAELLMQPASEYMTEHPFTLPSHTNLEQAVDLVQHRKIRHLLVTAVSGEIQGIVTQTDLVAAYSQLMKNNANQLERLVAERTAELANVNKKLMSLSLIDPLTGLGNRRAMEVDASKVHAAGLRHRRPYAIALFDIDFFKQYNDHYGHQAGDSVLELVASHLTRNIRECDSLYRYGGEEFMLLMPETDIEGAEIPVQRIIASLADACIPHATAEQDKVTLSAGLASSHHQGQRQASWRNVLELADEALYQAKANGRNQLIISEREPLQMVN